MMTFFAFRGFTSGHSNFRSWAIHNDPVQVLIGEPAKGRLKSPELRSPTVNYPQVVIENS